MHLGDRMKAAEHAHRRVLPKHQNYLLLRLDGRAFHTYTRGLERPYDTVFAAAMDQTMLALCNEIQGVRLAYVQSDEISLLVTDWADAPRSSSAPDGVKRSEPWMGGVEAKILSLSAAIASTAFHAERWRTGEDGHDRAAVFDARLWTFPATLTGRSEVANYFLWRQRDAIKNSVTMAAYAVFSHNEMQGVNTGEKKARLRAAGKPWEQTPEGFRYGRLAARVTRTDPMVYRDKSSGKLGTTEVTRRPFVAGAAPQFADLIDGPALRGVLGSTIPLPLRFEETATA